MTEFTPQRGWHTPEDGGNSMTEFTPKGGGILQRMVGTE